MQRRFCKAINEHQGGQSYEITHSETQWERVPATGAGRCLSDGFHRQGDAMLQLIENSRGSIAEMMIDNFSKDDGLKRALNYIELAIDSVERNHDHSDEVSIMHIAKLAIREKLLLLAYK
jgi:hypothetical protein